MMGEMVGSSPRSAGEATEGDRGLTHSLLGVIIYEGAQNDGVPLDDAVVGRVSG